MKSNLKKIRIYVISDEKSQFLENYSVFIGIKWIVSYQCAMNLKMKFTGSQATPFTKPLCPFNVVIDCKLFVHQTIIELSTLLLHSQPSWGDQARSRISAEMFFFCLFIQN